MRRARFGLVVVVFGCAAALLGCGGSSWDSAVEGANRAGKPLIVEFYADWCKPCKRFERTVLADDEVKKSLTSITFHRYDFDSTAGRHHARRLRVNGVPTFVAVGRDGAPIGAVRGAVSKTRFMQFLEWTRTEVSAQTASR